MDGRNEQVSPESGSVEEGPGPQVLGRLPAQRFAYLALLADSRYRRYFAATFASSLGDWVGVLAILALTESVLGTSRATAFAFSGVMIARILPVMLLGPVAGVFADRWDRRRTLVATDVARAVVMAGIPFAQNFFQLFVASFVVELASMLFAPAKEATLPKIVPSQRLVHANQLTLSVTYGTLPLGGMLFALFVGIRALLPDSEFLDERPEAVAIWANAVTFLISAALFAGMDLPRRGSRPAPSRAPETNAWQELVAGLRFIATRRRVRALVAGVMAAAFAGGVLFALAKLFVSVVGAGQSGFGILVAVTGVGMLVGLVAAAPAAERFDHGRLFAPGVALGGLSATVAAFTPGVPTASVAALFMGAGAGLAFVTGYTMLQQETDDAVRGRAFAAFNTGVRLALFAALVLAPAVVGILGVEGGSGYEIGGVRVTMALGGLVALGGALWSMRQLKADDRMGTPTGAPSGWPGLFVVFEGGEGAGKSTQIRLLRDAVERAGHDVVVTREPGGTALGERLRGLLLDPTASVEPRAEALLYAAARAQHAEEVLRPALAKGCVVICDRYLDSSIAYQGAGRGLGEREVAELSRWGTDGLMPDLVVLLDIDPVEGLGRAGRRDRGRPDRLEAESLEFHRRAARAYRRRAADEPRRFLVVDARRLPDEIGAEIAAAVLDLLDSRRAVDNDPQPGEALDG